MKRSVSAGGARRKEGRMAEREGGSKGHGEGRKGKGVMEGEEIDDAW